MAFSGLQPTCLIRSIEGLTPSLRRGFQRQPMAHVLEGSYAIQAVTSQFTVADHVVRKT